MESMKTSNKLIAEFMGLKPIKDFGDEFSITENGCRCIEDTAEKALDGFASKAKYHTSWVWLVPVVKLCGERGLFNSHPFEAKIDKALMERIKTLEIEDLHQVVLEFIQYYNEVVSEAMKVRAAVFLRSTKDMAGI